MGCFGIETDVWLYDNELYVGHNPSALTKERTLSTLYIQPLIQILTRQNPTSPFVTKPTRKYVLYFNKSPSCGHNINAVYI